MDDGSTLEQRVEALAGQMEILTKKVASLERRLAPGNENTVASPVMAKTAAAPAPRVKSGEEPEDVSEEILSWAGRASLLPRLSTLCFLLVAALVLRAITDYKIIDTLIGSVLGMAYAATLIGVGWYKYRQGSPLAPVFAACGSVLMSVIVVETHTRFLALPLVPAYLTLMVTGTAMAIISYQFNVFVPISIGTLAMCLAGAAMDYPTPYFPYLSMVLWTATILGYFAAQLKRCSWLRWTVLVVTIMMLTQWGIRFGQALYAKEPPPPSLASAWFLPIVAIFAATYALLAIFGIIRGKASRISRFDFFIPAVNISFTYAISYYVVTALGTGLNLLGWIGIAAAVGHFVLAFWLASRGKASGGENSFILAGTALLALALPGATGSFIMSLPVLALAAFSLIIISRHWQNGGTRAISYAVQIYAAGALAVYLKSSGTNEFLTVIPAGLIAVSSLYQYQLARASSVPKNAWFFSDFDTSDRTAVLLLLASLSSGFFMLRAAVYQVLILNQDNPVNTFRCSQSVMINVAAAGLMLFASYRRNKEIRNVAILVTVIGIVKVFLYDMLGTHGLPQVISILSFGLAAALESVLLGRWAKTGPEPTVSAEDRNGTNQASPPEEQESSGMSSSL
jgi:Predicted membrane protein (DUF2339)